MRNIVKYFVKYSVWVNVTVILFLVFGLLALRSTKSSFFAPIDPRQIKVQLTYPGASPTEIEEGIVLKIEDNLKGILGIERTSSVSQENAATITVEISKFADPENVLNDVKNAVDRISSFPSDMEPPVVYKLPMTDFAIRFVLAGDVSLKALKEKAQAVERDLLAFENISLVELSGFPEEEIEISTNSDVLNSFGITLDDLALGVRRANLDLTGGKIKSSDEEILIRSKHKSLDVLDIESYPIKSLPNGTIIRVKDVADVNYTWADDPSRIYFNGKPSVSITINKSKNEDILSIAETVTGYIETFNLKEPDIQAKIVRDQSVVLKQRIKLLTKNGIVGFLLVFVSLALFLNMRLSFWVAMSVPISFLGMFILGAFTGLTINVISLFGMIVVVGILVDDGIVIGENVFQRHEKGDPVNKAAINGTMDVLPSVFFAIITTVVAFTPFFFLDGTIADIMGDMAAVVIMTLSVSLIEATLILPAHLAHSKALLHKVKKSALQRGTDKVLYVLKHKLYEPALTFSLNNKFITLMIPIALFMMTIGAMKGGFIKGTFFPFVDGDSISINLRMPAGTKAESTSSVMRSIESSIWTVNSSMSAERSDGNDVIQYVAVVQTKDGHVGRLDVSLLDGETRNLESFKITQAIREEVGPLHQAESVEYGGQSFFGKPISISLLSNNMDELAKAKIELKSELNSLPTLKDVLDNDEPGAREIHISLKEKARVVGLSEQMVMDQIRKGFFGIEAKRLQRGVDEIKVWVRLNKQERSAISNLERLDIKAPNGSLYPLKTIASVDIKRSTMIINHLNSMREIKVEANLANQKDPVPPILNNILDNILPPILEKYPSVRYSLEGQKRETDKTTKSASVVMPVTLFVMFIVITLAFRSFFQSALVMAMIPFAFIGMAWGHFIHNMSINLLSIFGFIALIGILVNDSIVFTNTMNQLLKQGLPFKKAVFEAGLSRFRAILLTSLSTILGLGPLIFEKSRQAQFLIPMAISVAYGLAFATLLILIVLPTGHMVINNIRQFWAKLMGKSNVTAESVEPAVLELDAERN